MPEVQRLSVPAAGPVPSRPTFPLAASLAPVVVSVAIWGVTGSVFALLFAALGPVVAVAGILDGARQRRSAQRREQRRYTSALDALADRIDTALGEELSRREGRRPDPEDPVAALGIVAAWGQPPAPVLVLGRADQPSGLVLDDDPEGVSETARERLEQLRQRAATLVHAPLIVPGLGGVGIVGPEAAARALARELVLQLAAQLSPGVAEFALPEDESWAEELPHRVITGRAPGPGSTRRGAGRAEALVPPTRAGDDALRILVCWAPDVEGLVQPVATVLRLPGAAGPAGLLRPPGEPADRFRPLGASRAQAGARARGLAELAARHGLRPAGGRLPERVAFADLAGDPPEGSLLAAAVGMDEDGPVWLDLLRDGPHALVAGMTGSGKSELLISWVLALALRHPPSALSFLLVDFKGGASFAPLAGLPHVAGVVSDLDDRRARRAMTGLRAELRRRERVLAEARVRAIEELAPGVLARLVVVVDEYAAVVSDHPELHEVFADLAARGRSLGVHLVLCTQRPSGVVRETVLANIGLRLALRLADRADSQAILGSDAAARLPPVPAGRALVADGRGLRLVQLALTGPSDAERARTAHPTGGPAAQPWSDPLPARLLRSQLATGPPGSLVFGLADVPEEQRHALACYEPSKDGPLLVLGAARSGRSTALAALVEAAGPAAIAVPVDPAPAWTLLEELAAAAEAGAAAPLVVLDDFDELLLRAGPARSIGLLERIERLMRRAPAAGCGVVLAASGAGGSASGLLRGISCRLLLRQATRDEHMLAGLDLRDFDPAQPAGAGWWRDRAVQVGLPGSDAGSLLAAAARYPCPPELSLAGRYAVVSTRPSADAKRWRSAGIGVVEVAGRTQPESDRAHAGLLIGDPDSWQAAWAVLAAARRELPFLVDGRVAPAELRALTRLREDPPPLDENRGDEWWLVEDGRALRVRLVEASVGTTDGTG